MPYECNECGRTYGGFGAAGLMGQHLRNEHNDVLVQAKQDNESVYSGNVQGNGKHASYDVFASKVCWCEADHIVKKNEAGDGWIARDPETVRRELGMKGCSECKEFERTGT